MSAHTMIAAVRNTLKHPVLALGSVVLWGLIELIALQRNRFKSPG